MIEKDVYFWAVTSIGAKTKATFVRHGLRHFVKQLLSISKALEAQCKFYLLANKEIMKFRI